MNFFQFLVSLSFWGWAIVIAVVLVVGYGFWRVYGNGQVVQTPASKKKELIGAVVAGVIALAILISHSFR